MDAVRIRNVGRKYIIIWISKIILRISNVETKREFRSLEKVYKKLQKVNCDILFNETCLRNDLLPNYTRLKLHFPSLRSPLIAPMSPHVVSSPRSSSISFSSASSGCLPISFALQVLLSKFNYNLI